MKKLFLALGLALVASTSIYAKTDAPRKTVSILGDSYSTFQYYVTPENNKVWYTDPVRSYTDVADVKQTWWHKYITENGYKLGVNNSYSGATICNTDYWGGDATPFSFVTRHTNLGNPDIIFIFGGTNDAWASVPMGDYKYEGWVNGDLFQFRPAMSYLIQKTLDRYPGTEVYVIINDNIGTDVPAAIKEICNHYGVQTIELQGIDKKEGHPSQLGMQQICDQLNKAIKK